MTKKTPKLPSSGGSYIRAKNGVLTQKQKPTEEPSVTPKPKPQRKPRATTKPKTPPPVKPNNGGTDQ